MDDVTLASACSSPFGPASKSLPRIRAIKAINHPSVSSAIKPGFPATIAPYFLAELRRQAREIARRSSLQPTPFVHDSGHPSVSPPPLSCSLFSRCPCASPVNPNRLLAQPFARAVRICSSPESEQQQHPCAVSWSLPLKRQG